MAVVAGVPWAAGAQEAGVIDVIQVSGRIDPVVTDFVQGAVERAAASKSEVLVIQLDTQGVLVSPAQFAALAQRIRTSPVPVAVWVGPTGASAARSTVALLGAAGVAGMAPGTKVAGFGPDGAKARGLVSTTAPTLGEFVVNLDGLDVGGKVLHTARVVPEGDSFRREQAGQVRFGKLGLTERLLHLTADPAVAYLLLMVGLLLIVFEFFTAGVGVAGITGAAALILSAYGLAVLPTSWFGLGLIGLGVFGYSVDVQAGAPRTWTGIGVVSLLVGSWRLFPGDLAVPWLVIVLVAGGTALFMLSGMTAMLRARFSTPTIGRESMIGEMGQATTGIDPEGMVDLRGGKWRARTNRATPISAGDRIRVVAIDGLLLEVEPETGGAKDAHH
ncbi:MAG TPA: NfeD family protein [Acidimicrobiales bacterium]|jgi:membrane-bound serine protease (ClpP class)|nr:NfeD family protein [Acidimicrobiales bacterium]